MSEVSLGAVVSLTEAADMVEHVGENVSFIFKGEMGIGKSAILSTLADRLGDAYRYVYAETQTFDVGDVSGVPFTELINGVKVTRFAPNILTGCSFRQAHHLHGR
jgi:ClpP class serine protease